MAVFQFALHNLVLGFVLLSILVLLYLYVSAGTLGRDRTTHLLVFLGALVFPLLAGAAVLSQNMQRATETRFCLSCHEMEPYGKSLYIDESSAVQASHFQNRRIPRDEACYTCHKDYGLFGDVKSKLTGLRHVYVHFLGTVPEKIQLYHPFRNDNCLHCHAGMRRFDEGKKHNAKNLKIASLYTGEVSCVSKGCHDTGHMIDQLGDVDFWDPAKARAAASAPQRTSPTPVLTPSEPTAASPTATTEPGKEQVK